MEVTSIPFVAKIGLTRNEAGTLVLPCTPSAYNHLGGMHASAQFTLAETASGDELQRRFPELVGKVVPVLREARIKFRKPSSSDLFAFPTVAEEEAYRFREQFTKKRRATITVEVAVKESTGAVTSVGVFEWFVQGIAEPE